MSPDFIVFGAPQIEREEIDEVVRCLESGWIGTGPRVAQFETEFAAYKGQPFAAAVGSCTAAMHLSVLAAGLAEGDEVITTPLTFCATVNAIIHAGATPVLADIDGESMNIDPIEIEGRITPRTKAIVPVHFAGRPCDMKSITAIAERHRLRIIEDCAHAIETEYHGRKAGTFGDFGCFSFYATKNVTTGEGGMVLTRNENELARIRMLALHGMSKDAWKRFSDEGYKHYFVVESGFKCNMMDLQAAIGIHQLRRVEANWKRREEIWSRYNDAFSDLPVTLPAPPEPETRHAYHLYTLLVDQERAGVSRDEFLEAMTAHNIGVGVHYLSIPEHPVYQEKFGWQPADYPNAMRVGRETVSLPLSAKLTNSEVSYVVEAVRNVLSAKSKGRRTDGLRARSRVQHANACLGT
ncbi:MAG TPA: DegT/DnrJ/EryC1/StrS family aminotransferase [Pyrinomonadaceae bacterium]|nr:DegT/DnrJ/EryC1/StrS family aminotransferase [Pyrinomonadaceae bacterium]